MTRAAVDSQSDFESETGLGPWKSSSAYNHDAAEHAPGSCASDIGLNTRCSFALPLLFKELVRRHRPDDTSPFSLTPRFRIPQYSCRRQLFYYRGYRFRWDHGSSKGSCWPVSCPVCLGPACSRSLLRHGRSGRSHQLSHMLRRFEPLPSALNARSSLI